MFPELLLYSYHQKQCVMEKTDGNTVKYIYIATTERHEKKGIYKVGYTTRDASEKRSPELCMYAPFSDSIYEMKRIYEANDTDGNPDNAFRNWVKAKHNICTMTPEEIMQVFNWTSDVVKIIPDIDWSDPKVKTDQGILELCGMAPDRAKYWADYCADKIYQVDHGKQI